MYNIYNFMKTKIRYSPEIKGRWKFQFNSDEEKV